MLVVQQPDVRFIALGLRPLRCAFLIPYSGHWEDHCIETIETMSQTWGGRHSLIVPTDGTTIKAEFWQFLDQFDPDCVYSISEDRGGPKLDGQLLDQLIRCLNPFQAGVGDPVSRFWPGVSLSWPVTPLVPVACRLSKGQTIVNLDVEGEHKLRLLVYSISGKFSGTAMTELRNGGASCDAKPCRPGMQGDVFPRVLLQQWKRDLTRAISGISPYETSMLGLERRVPRESYARIAHPETPPLVVCGSSLDDFCLYHDLATMGLEVCWLPRGAGEADHQAYQTICDCVGCLLRDTPPRSQKKTVMFTSVSEGPEELEPIVESVKRCQRTGWDGKVGTKVVSSDAISQLVPYSCVVWESNNSPSWYAEHFARALSVNTLRTPLPRSFGSEVPDEVEWLVEARLHRCRLPRRACLNSLVLCNWQGQPWVAPSGDTVRVGRDGIVYHGKSQLVFQGQALERAALYPRLKVFDGLELFIHLFESAGYYIGPSDGGNYTDLTIANFGSLSACAEQFRKKAVRDLLERFQDVNSKSQRGKGMVLRKDEPRYLELPAIAQILGDEENARDFLDDWLEKGILHRGIALKCERCRNDDWYAVADLTDEFTCKRCGNQALYTSTHYREHQPEWFYRLDEVVFQACKKQVILQVLTLAKLEEDSQGIFTYAPEIELRKSPNSEKPDTELDICCVCDGRLVLGECKKVGKIEQNQRQKLASVIKNMRPERFVLSTLATGWEQGTKDWIENVGKGISPVPMGLITLSGDQLLRGPCN